MTSYAIQQHRYDRRRIQPTAPVEQPEWPTDIILLIEGHLESWRQLTHFINLARAKRFDRAEEDQFLELKGVIVQELEMIMATGECASPTKETVHEMMNNAPSMRSLSQMNEGTLRNLENQWHLIYIAWHATMGQLKTRHSHRDSHSKPTGFTSFFTKS